MASNGLRLFFERVANLPPAVRRAIAAELEVLAREGIAYWRGRVPVRTGELRRALRAELIRGLDGVVEGLGFTVRGQRGRVYIILGASVHPQLQRVMTDWITRVANPRINRAIDRAIASNR